MEILNQFGFDLKLFVAQIVNFLVIAFVFKKFLYKPILSILDQRKLTIKKGLLDAERAQKELEKAEIKSEELLNKASKEAEKLIDEAKTQAQEAREEMVAKTKSDIEKMMAETKLQIDLERENFKKEAEDLSLELSRQILNRTLGSLFDPKQKDILVKKGLSLIEHDKQAKN